MDAEVGEDATGLRTGPKRVPSAQGLGMCSFEEDCGEEEGVEREVVACVLSGLFSVVGDNDR